MQVTSLKGFPLSMQQERLWLLQQESLAYRSQCAVEFEGFLNMVAFQQAFRSVLHHHDILRTVFTLLADMEMPVQVVADTIEAGCMIVDLEGLSLEVVAGQIQEGFDRFRIMPLHLQQAPLMRAILFRLSPYRHTLLIGLPALCADVTTLKLYLTELCLAYTASLRGTSLDDEPLQYADVSAWQDELLSNTDRMKYSSYWQRMDLSQAMHARLPFIDAGVSENLLSTMGPFQPYQIDLSLERSVWEQLQVLALRSTVSIEAFILACWCVLCCQLTDEMHLLVGVACDGRSDEELSDALGLYTRFMPVKAVISDEIPFEQVAMLIQASLEKATEEQLYFAWKNGGAAQRFFPLNFQYLVWPPSQEADGLVMTLSRYYSCTEPFLLMPGVLNTGAQACLEMRYDPRVIGDEQAQSLLALLSTLLQNALMQPQTPVGRLSLLSFAQQEAFFAALHAPRTLLPERTFSQLFEEQVLCRPEQLAVVSNEGRLTYHELNSRANQLARVLRSYGAGPGVFVCLCLSRSLSMIIGLLAILKSGSAYVPLDPESPRVRRDHQLQDVGASLLLTQQSLLDRFSAWSGRTLCLEALKGEMADADVTNLEPLNLPQDLAYVIYTSGSTGLPKGVMVSQRNVVNYALALCNLLQGKSGWHYMTVSTLAADLGNTAIFCALTSGGCLHIPAYDTITSPEAFARWMEQYPIDVLKIVPSHLSALLLNERAQSLLPHQALVLGGEELHSRLLQRLQELGCGCRVFNHYGPTETTIGVLVNALGKLQDLSQEQFHCSITGNGDGVPLGQPVANTEVYILNRGLQVVPPGVTGELYVGGAGLSLGYLKRPEATAECFVPHPFGQRPGMRLYRTGDLVRYRQDGAIEFIGRRDNQVKIRGYRVELGEVEVVLRRHDNVRDAVVLLQSGLVGYVVARQQPAPTIQDLRLFMQEHLPEYMVPTQWFLLATLPLTANGKVDRQRLSVWEQTQEAEAAATLLPRGPIEEILLEIWEELLGVSSISVEDNFFELGGHSLLATRLMARLQSMMQIEVPLTSLFEAPTITALAQLVELALRGEQRREIAPILAVSRTGSLPLSFAQQRLWFLARLDPESAAYLIPHALRLDGPLNVGALEYSLTGVMQRHEILRTTFHSGLEQDNQPVQIIHPAGKFWLPVVDLGELVAWRAQEEVERLASQEAQRFCDLENGPLMRSTIVRLEGEAHVLLLTLHHIISDAWSNTIFLREITALYNARIADLPNPLSALPLQYADFAFWQRAWLQEEMLERQLNYWVEYLSALPPLALLGDRSRPQVQTVRGALKTIALPDQLQRALKQMSQREGVTLFMTLLAVFQILLARYSGQTDFAIGTPIANRTRAEVEGLIGFFTNTLVLRADLSGQPTVLEVLARVRQAALAAYAHQDVPFEKLVEVLQPERDLSRSPLFQVMFILQHSSSLPETFQHLTLTPLPAQGVTAKFDLTFVVLDAQQELFCGVEYNTDLFEEATITRMLGHWKILLESIVVDPTLPFTQLPLLTEDERYQMLREWNATQRKYSRDLCVHQFFEMQVEHTPEVIAATFEQEALTYRELNQRANQLASHLRSLGIGPDVLVGISMQRSLELIIGLLGILKAGGAYVPLDPDYPQERISFMLADTQAPVLLALSHLKKTLPEFQAQLLCLDTDWPVIAQASTANVESGVQPDNLVYVLYTSGSTGRPKGVMNTHRGICNRLLWGQETYQNTQQDRILQKTPFSFDVSVPEFFGPLIAGARLIIARPEGHKDPVYLADVLRMQEITAVHFVPSMLQVFLLEACHYAYPSLQRVFCSGEALSLELQERFFSCMQAELHNLYGPTEAAIEATAWACRREGGQRRVPIGYPIANVQTYILDQRLQSVPPGVVGELYIGGAGVARGYLNRPELTGQVFLADPFSTEAGARLYKSGDRARYLQDGSIEFLGRLDYQIKLRGYRIEIGEIESLLSQHPHVRECVVVAQEVRIGETRLVAYIVSHTSDREQSFAQDAFRHYLRQRLPEYMVPSLFVHLDALPLTPSGKVHRGALPSPADGIYHDSGVSFVAPRTLAETVVADIWAHLLGIQQVGVYDNFFALGGHSLLATQVVTRLARAFQVELPLRCLFESPTVDGLISEIACLHGGRAVVEEIAQVLQEIKELTDQEVQQHLSSIE